MRTIKTYKKQGTKANYNLLRLCTSSSPRLNNKADFFEGLDSMCESTRKDISQARNGMNSFRYQIEQNSPTFEEFKERNEDIISDCQEFLFEKKYSLKTSQEILFTKKLQKSMARKMIG
jgi:hypothetical protein